MTKDKFYKAQNIDHDIRELSTFLHSYKKPYAERTFGCGPSQAIHEFVNKVLKEEHESINRKASAKLVQLQKEFDNL